MSAKSVQRKIKRWWGLAPIILFLGIFFLGSVFFAIVQGFGYAPHYGVAEFPTLQYYEQVLSSSYFWPSLWLTLYYSIVPTFIGMIISLALAMTLSQKFKARNLAHIVYKVPMVVPYLVGVGLVILLFSNGGIFARLFYAMGLIQSPGEFPRIIQTSGGWGIMLVYLWKQIPFMTLVIYSNLLVLGKETEEVAKLLGANRLQSFIYVILPRLLPSILTATLIVFAFNFGSFEVPYILGGSFPNTLVVEAWRLFDSPDYTKRPEAMVVATFVFLLSAVILFFYMSGFRKYLLARGYE